MTDKEKFDKLLPMWLFEYKRTNGVVYPGTIVYEGGYILGAGSPTGLAHFERSLMVLKGRVSFTPEPPIEPAVLEVLWFTSNSTTGIAVVRNGVVRNGVGAVNAYIGRVLGNDEEHDIQYLLEWGSKVDLEYLVTTLAKHLPNE